MIGIVSVWNPKRNRIIGFQNIIGYSFITLWVLLLLRLRRHTSICQRRQRRCISLCQRRRLRIALGQRLLGYLVEIPQWERERDRKHHWSTTQQFEQLRSHPKVITHFRYYDVNSCDVTSRDVTFGHVTSGSHATYGHTQWYILYYYYGKKKAREYAEHTPGYDVTSGHVTSCDVISGQGRFRWRHFQ